MSSSALALLSGDAQTFLTKVWASRVHLHQADPADLVGLLSLDDADHLLTSTAIRTPSVRLAKDGSVLPESAYTRSATLAGKPLTGLVDPRKALALFDEGATVVFQGLHRYWPPLTRLIAELELELGHPCQANAYLTPPGSQGFAVHSDSHDVFVFQTAGHKQWEVHTPDGVEDIRLEPGLSMYLPTGTPHAARAQDTVSLHVTLGINQLTWRGLLRRTIESVLDEVPDDHLPAGYLDDPADLAAALAGRLGDVAASIVGVDPQRAVEAEVRRFLTSRSPRLPGGLDRRPRGPRPHRRVGAAPPPRPPLRADRCCPTGDRLEVLLGDRSLDVPARVRPAIERIRRAVRAAPGRPGRAARRAEPPGAVPPAGARRAARDSG